jgi:O-antigen/teichoic acid export membrane protein
MTTTRSPGDPEVTAEATPAGALPVPPTLLSRGISAAGIMLLATVITNATNYAYSLLMGRQLGPELFGEFTALLGVLMILSVASQTVQTVVARYSTGLQTDQGPEAVVDFARRLMWRLTLVGIGAFILWIPIAFPLAAVLQIDSPVPVIAAGSALILGFSLPVVWGAFQGEQRFRDLGLNMCVLSVGRFVLGALLVFLGASVAGAVGALTIATAVAFVLAYPSVRSSLGSGRRVGPPARALVAYGLPTTLGLAAWTLLTNLDIVFVKAAESSTEAGYYGAAATIGKIALFLPLALGLVIFPKAAARHVAGQDSRFLMRRTGQAVVAASAVLVIVCAVFGSTAIELMFGASYAPADELLVPVVGAMCCFALTNVMLFYYLSVHRMRFAWMLFGAVVVQVVALALAASDPLAVAYVQLAVGLAIVAINEIFFVPLFAPIR